MLEKGNWLRAWEIKQVLYTDDTVLVAESREYLQHIASEFEMA